MNILIKLTAIVSLIIAPHIAMKKSHGHKEMYDHYHGTKAPVQKRLKKEEAEKKTTSEFSE